jgi:PncC family amidohydrolase
VLFQEALDDASVDFESKLYRDIAKLLKKSGLTIAVGETLTGGMFASKIFELPGSSVYFRGGVICNHNLVHVQVCGVSPALISKKGAINKEVALEIANGIKKRFAADLSIAITGICNNEVDEFSENTTGVVSLGFVFKNEQKAKDFKFSGTYQSIRTQSIVAALGILRQWLITEIS